jgi:hypothetical protein
VADDVSDDMCERAVPGGALNLNSTGYPDHGRCGDLPLQGKNPTAEPRIKPGTSCLVVRSSDHQATRLVVQPVYIRICGNMYIMAPRLTASFELDCPEFDLQWG